MAAFVRVDTDVDILVCRCAAHFKMVFSYYAQGISARTFPG